MSLIIAGSYEGGLHGWTGSDLTLRFSFVAQHNGCARSAAAMKRVLISGGDDETLRIYNVKSFRQTGEVAMKGTITSVAFCGETHVLVGSGDGTISAFRLSDFECVHIFGGHKASVRSVACHPSGKLALSTAADRTLRLWDLTAGRSAFITRTKGVADKVNWAPDGSCYAYVIAHTVDVKHPDDNSRDTVLSHQAAVQDLVCLGGALSSCVVTADAKGSLTLWDATTATILWTRDRASQNATRIKALAVLPTTMASTTETSSSSPEDRLARWSAAHRIVAATSSGRIETWRFDDDNEDPSATADVGTRLTCLCVAPLEEEPAPSKKKRKPPPVEEEKKKESRAQKLRSKLKKRRYF